MDLLLFELEVEEALLNENHMQDINMKYPVFLKNNVSINREEDTNSAENDVEKEDITVHNAAFYFYKVKTYFLNKRNDDPKNMRL